MTANVGVGSANKNVSDIHVGVGGAWEPVSGGWVGVGGTWKRFFASVGGGGAIVDPFTEWDMLADQPAGDSASASLTFASDGSVGGNATQDGGSTTGSTSWFTPNIGGIGASYYIKYTATSGSFTTNEASTFTILSSARTVTKSAITGASTVTFTVEIATDSGGSNIVFTSTGNVLRYQHTL